MQLDANTLIFSIGILSLLMAFVSWTFPSAIAERDDGLRLWAVGAGCVGLSLLLTFLRAQLPSFFSLFLPSALLLAGGLLGLLAPAKFFRVRVPAAVMVMTVALFLGGLAVDVLVDEEIELAMFGVRLAMALLLGYTVWLVLWHSRKPMPWPARLFAASVGLMGMAYGMRAFVVVLEPQLGVAPVSLAGSHQFILVFGGLSVVASTISFYSMVHDEQKRELAERAKRDALTGLFNRRAFFDMAAAAEKQGQPFSIVMVDIDHFKAINDTCGHLGGDAVLGHAGRLILGFFRLEDIACRFGGEEFCVLMRRCEGLEALERAIQLVEAFHRHSISLPDGRPLQISISAGVSEHTAGTPLLKTIQRADEALYEAKHAGRNQARFAVPARAATPA